MDQKLSNSLRHLKYFYHWSQLGHVHVLGGENAERTCPPDQNGAEMKQLAFQSAEAALITAVLPIVRIIAHHTTQCWPYAEYEVNST